MEQNDDVIELWDIGTVCRFFGGSGRPLHPSTVYRGMAADPPRFPRPVSITANIKRWSAAECRAAVRRMLAEHNKPQPPSRRGRPKKVDKPIEPAVVSKPGSKKTESRSLRK